MRYQTLVEPPGQRHVRDLISWESNNHVTSGPRIDRELPNIPDYFLGLSEIMKRLREALHVTDLCIGRSVHALAALSVPVDVTHTSCDTHRPFNPLADWHV